MIITQEQQQLRQQVLNPQQSFLVQAPAGSGKTELLTQRFLSLLSQVNSPEEIIAITFTRKAANEMRHRILNALERAQQPDLTIMPHQHTTHQLAIKALAHSAQHEWHLLQNPNRLRILTIDALAAHLCAQMPILTAFGAPPKITENPTLAYQQAIHHLLNYPDCHSHFETLLLHLDNNFKLLEKLLIQMLSKRDQWLPHLVSHRNNPDMLKTVLQQGLETVVIEQMMVVKAALPPDIVPTLITCAVFAGQNQQSPCATLQELPGVDLSAFPLWQTLADLLLTKSGEWRKKVNKTCGFPAASDAPHPSLKSFYQEKKQQMEALLAHLSENTLLQEKFSAIQHALPIQYHPAQWQMIHALIELLPLLAAALNVVFQTEGIIDFAEVTQGALRALGENQLPSDLALHLDYQIRHLLIDECQDTSITQFRLFEQLMRGWQPDDGRTIFLVGDPMQSIYRFRQAEVGLFLRAITQGIGGMPLKTMTLSENFRSRPAIIDWINQTFSRLFPSTPDIFNGGVPYSPVTASRTAEIDTGVFLHPLLNADEHQEAQHVVTLVRQYSQQNPTHSIAVLVRSRQSLRPIINALRQAHINFHGLDVETLYHHNEIQDVLSLTRALTHLGDRIAWLAILRAPWCGLSLSDLHALQQHADKKLIWTSLLDFQQISTLSVDGKQRLNRLVPVLSHSLKTKGRLPLSPWLEGTWLALGGPATLTDETALTYVDQFWQLLACQAHDFTIENFSQKLQQTYASTTDHLPSNIQLMTIHKAKGLEFDHVILPSLHRKVSADQQQLLLWLTSLTTTGGNNLILAPIKASKTDHEPIYQYLKSIENKKADYETQRLLYVAATRAKESLHLIGSVVPDTQDSTQLKKPIKDSFLDILWPSCHEQIIKNVVTLATLGIQEIDNNSKHLKRLPADWVSPLPVIHPLLE